MKKKLSIFLGVHGFIFFLGLIAIQIGGKSVIFAGLDDGFWYCVGAYLDGFVIFFFAYLIVGAFRLITTGE
jgi:hypothetical protein